MKNLLLILVLFFLMGCEKKVPKLEFIEGRNDSIVTSEFSQTDEIIHSVAMEHFNEMHLSPYGNGKNLRNSSGVHTDQEPDSTFTLKDKKNRDALYVFKYKKNGWQIISGDKRLHPILAYSNDGGARLDTVGNKGFKFWVDDFINLIDAMDKAEVKQSKELAKAWEKYLKKDSKNLRYVEPENPSCTDSYTIWKRLGDNDTNDSNDGFTGQYWNQTAGFNHFMGSDNCQPSSYYCNKYPAGCGAVAIGMIMSYYQKPLSYNLNGINKNITYSNMPSSIYWGSVNCSSPSSSQQEVAGLLRYVSGKYSQQWCFSVPFSQTSATALYPWNIRDTFSDWGYSNPGNKIDYFSNISQLKNNLKNRKPVIFSGSNCDACLWNAHIWLCEGLKESVISCNTYSWVFMNWGWGGSDNGWYATSSTYNGNGVNYNSANMKIVVDINP